MSITGQRRHGPRRFQATEQERGLVEEIRAKRERAKMSQEDMAASLEINVRSYRRIESFERPISRREMEIINRDLGAGPAAPPAALAEVFAEPQPPWPDLGNALRAARERAGLSQEAVADIAGVSRVTLWKYEEGWATKLDELYSIATALGMRLQVALWPRAQPRAAPSSTPDPSTEIR